MNLFGNRFTRGLRRVAGSIEVVHIPEQGIWDAVCLSRGQFFGILLLSILLFLFLDGPAWRHLRDSHTWRIIGSYGIIPLAVAVVQWRSRLFGWRCWFEASLLVALIKLLVTALLLIAFALLV